MKKCVDCGTELLRGVRSSHQPTIRCMKCWAAFTRGVVTFFAHAIAGTAGDKSAADFAKESNCPVVHVPGKETT